MTHPDDPTERLAAYPPPLRASASGRVPQWVLDEAAGREPVGVTGRDWPAAPPPPPPRRRKRRGGRLLLALMAVLVVVTGVVLDQRRPTVSAIAAAPDVPAVVAAPTDFPTPGREASRTPLGTPPAAPAEGGAFSFIELQPDGVEPVAYDPCRTVDVVVNLDGAPAGAEALVTDALARMAEVTGLQFRYQGPTDEPPTDQRAVFQPDRYGDRWAPVLIAWRTPEQKPALADSVAGLGGSAWASTSAEGTKVYVSGSITLDGPEFSALMDSRRGTAIARSILLHELGHVVGLQHVEDADQLMYPTTTGEVLDFAGGDLTGLAELGAGECVPAL